MPGKLPSLLERVLGSESAAVSAAAVGVWAAAVTASEMTAVGRPHWDLGCFPLALLAMAALSRALGTHRLVKAPARRAAVAPQRVQKKHGGSERPVRRSLMSCPGGRAFRMRFQTLEWLEAAPGQRCAARASAEVATGGSGRRR